MGKNSFLLLIIVSVSELLFAKGTPEKYIVYFKDKPADKNVAILFSEKALEKRKKFNIAFDARDYPVNANYIEQLRADKITILNASNWLNAVLVSATDKQAGGLLKKSFILSVKKSGRLNGHSGVASLETENTCEDITDFENTYASSYAQFHLLNGEYLHEQGFNGENMTIAVCDNGFYNANANPGFTHIFNEKRILGTYDYVNGDSLVYDDSNGKHGSNCFSFIGGLKENQYIGTASKSNFYLFHTENNGGERLQEEFNLAAALERCDQLGVDVVSVSLGYTTFDVLSENHDTSDLRKNNTPSAKAVNIASSKGILVCVAAGNEGSKPWKYISSPSDADSAFAIASVDINGVVAASSGYGLPNDYRVKPNVAAVGNPANYINTAGNVASGSGTSYATPSLAGMAACLWQAFPAKTNWEIKTAIEQSASQYLTPDKRMGYGIPDFKKAYQLLSSVTYVSNKSLENEISIFPNPFVSSVTISIPGNLSIQNITILNTIGQAVYSINAPSGNTLELTDLPDGIYLIQIATDRGMVIKKLMKD